MKNNARTMLARNRGTVILRWFWIAAIYAIWIVGTYYLMMYLLDGYMIMSPSGYSFTTWMSNIRMMFIITSGISLILILLWNLLFSWPVLGKRGIEKGANIWNAVFLFLHFLFSCASLYNLLRMEMTWITAFLLGSTECIIALILPMTQIFAFFFASRFMAPEVISYRFTKLKKFRSKLWIKYD